MPRGELPGILTGSFGYIRWLGDRLGIEKITKSWDKSIIDRRNDFAAWVPAIKAMFNAQLPVFGFVNNHYSGHAPTDVDTLRGLLADSLPKFDKV